MDNARNGQVTFDEYGRPFVIIRDQESKTRISGLDAQKVTASHHAVLHNRVASPCQPALLLRG
jgi:hypothetical protein